MKIPIAECKIHKMPDKSYTDCVGNQQMEVCFTVTGSNTLCREFVGRLMSGELELVEPTKKTKKKKKKK